MAHLLDLFTPETCAAFREVDATITAFHERHQHLAEQRVRRGDYFVSGLLRMAGLLALQPNMDLLELLRNRVWTVTWTSFVRRCGC